MLPSFKARVSDKQDSGVSAEIQHLLDSVKEASNYEEYWNIIDRQLTQNPQFEKIGSNTYKNGEFYITTSPELDAQYDKEILTGLGKNGITLAPEFVESASSKEGFAVTVLKIKGTNSGGLIDYAKGANLLSAQAKKSAYAQLQKLTKLGIANTAILDNGALKVTPDTPHRVVADNWDNLCPVEEYLADSSEASRRVILEKIYQKLFKP